MIIMTIYKPDLDQPRFWRYYSFVFSVFNDQFEKIELFSFKCRKTKAKVITLTNHNSRKQSNEPIRARSVRVNHDWFWFYF